MLPGVQPTWCQGGDGCLAHSQQPQEQHLQLCCRPQGPWSQTERNQVLGASCPHFHSRQRADAQAWLEEPKAAAHEQCAGYTDTDSCE